MEVEQDDDDDDDDSSDDNTQPAAAAMEQKAPEPEPERSSDRRRSISEPTALKASSTALDDSAPVPAPAPAPSVPSGDVIFYTLQELQTLTGADGQPLTDVDPKRKEVYLSDAVRVDTRKKTTAAAAAAAPFFPAFPPAFLLCVPNLSRQIIVVHSAATRISMMHKTRCHCVIIVCYISRHIIL